MSDKGTGRTSEMSILRGNVCAFGGAFLDLLDLDCSFVVSFFDTFQLGDSGIEEREALAENCDSAEDLLVLPDDLL